jgi:hypothetical protein
MIAYLTLSLLLSHLPIQSTAVIVGSWQGTSTCVNLQAAPACRNENVIYVVRRSPDKSGVVILAADKIVSGKHVPMGNLEFAYSGVEKCWRSEFKTPGAHGVWCFVVRFDSLTGTLRELPGNTVVREVRVRKVAR